MELGIGFWIVIALIIYWGRTPKPGTVGSWNGYWHLTKEDIERQKIREEEQRARVERQRLEHEVAARQLTFPREWAETRNPE